MKTASPPADRLRRPGAADQDRGPRHADTLAALEARLAHINLRVPVALVPSDPAELAALFALDAFVLSDVLEQSPGFPDQAAPQRPLQGGGRFQLRPPRRRHRPRWCCHPGRVDVGLMGNFVRRVLLRRTATTCCAAGASPPCAGPGAWCSRRAPHHRLRLRPRLDRR